MGVYGYGEYREYGEYGEYGEYRKCKGDKKSGESWGSVSKRPSTPFPPFFRSFPHSLLSHLTSIYLSFTYTYQAHIPFFSYTYSSFHIPILIRHIPTLHLCFSGITKRHYSPYLYLISIYIYSQGILVEQLFNYYYP